MTLLPVVLLTILGIALVMLAMSIGVVLSGRCLRGSCGGPDIVGADGESLLCATCPNRPAAPDQGD
jgi:hypothetical protein